MLDALRERLGLSRLCGARVRPASDMESESTQAKREELLLRATALRQQASRHQRTAEEKVMQLQSLRAQKYDTEVSRRVPSDFTLWSIFFLILASSGCFYSSIYVLEPSVAAYLDSSNSIVVISIMTAIQLLVTLVIPVANDAIERQGDAMPMVQGCNISMVSGVLLFICALTLKSLPVLYLGSIFVGFASQVRYSQSERLEKFSVTTQGVVFAMITVFATAAPNRSGSINAMGVCATSMVTMHSFLIGAFPPVRQVEGSSEADLTSLYITLIVVLVAWVTLLNTPRDNYELSAYLPASSTSRPTGLLVSICSAGRGVYECLFASRYRALLVASVSSGVFSGTVTYSMPQYVYYLEDFVSTDAQTGSWYMAVFGVSGSLFGGVSMIPAGLCINRVGGLPAMYLASVLAAAPFAGIVLLPPSVWMINTSWFSLTFSTFLFTTGLLDYVIKNLLPDKRTMARDVTSFLLQIGMIPAIGSPAAAGVSVGLGKLVRLLGISSSGINVGGRVKYSLLGYQCGLLTGGALLLAAPFVIHIAGACTKHRNTSDELMQKETSNSFARAAADYAVVVM
ncbi:MAG: hypothetical protein SGPRY_010057 [Prymnesium sp.]